MDRVHAMQVFVTVVDPRHGAPPPKVRAFVEYLAERYRSGRVLSVERSVRLAG